MTDVKNANLRSVRERLSGDVEIRLPKAWLAIGVAVVVALLIIALD